MRPAVSAPFIALLALGLGACAGFGAPRDPTAGLENAQVTQRVAENGDVIEEYRVAGQLRVVKVTPVRGRTYYLIDEDGDGRPEDGSPVTPVSWKLFEWN